MPESKLLPLIAFFQSEVSPDELAVILNNICIEILFSAHQHKIILDENALMSINTLNALRKVLLECA